jgi:hypothetical protein
VQVLGEVEEGWGCINRGWVRRVRRGGSVWCPTISITSTSTIISTRRHSQRDQWCHKGLGIDSSQSDRFIIDHRLGLLCGFTKLKVIESFVSPLGTIH